jgi:hypothetical protein
MENKDVYELAESHGSWSMSDFQSRYFVVNSQVTNYRRVRQALLEIETRIAAKKQIERNVRKTETEKKILQRSLAAEQDELQRELIEIDIDQCDYDLSVYAKKYKVCLEELESFAGIICDVVPDIETLETYKKHNEVEERNYWIARMAKQATMDLMMTGRIGQGNLDSIAMMPVLDQQETIKAALMYNGMLNKGISSLEKQAMEELQALPSNINYIDEIVNNQLKLAHHEVQPTSKPETI